MTYFVHQSSDGQATQYVTRAGGGAEALTLRFYLFLPL